MPGMEFVRIQGIQRGETRLSQRWCRVHHRPPCLVTDLDPTDVRASGSATREAADDWPGADPPTGQWLVCKQAGGDCVE